MKRLFKILCLALLVSCSSDNDNPGNCNFLINAAVNLNVNLNLPQFSQLQFTNNPIYISGQGNNGIIMNNTGLGLRAWDATDPNHVLSTCSILSIDGIKAICNCADANEYELTSGQPFGATLPCGLKEYRVENLGDNTFLVIN